MQVKKVLSDSQTDLTELQVSVFPGQSTAALKLTSRTFTWAAGNRRKPIISCEKKQPTAVLVRFIFALASKLHQKQ